MKKNCNGGKSKPAANKGFTTGGRPLQTHLCKECIVLK